MALGALALILAFLLTSCVPLGWVFSLELSWHGDLDLFTSDVFQLHDAAILDHLSGSLGCLRTGKRAYDWQVLVLRVRARACTLCLHWSPEALTLNPFIRISQ